MTGDHPIWVVDTGWVHARTLRRGDPLVSATGECLAVASVEPIAGVHTVFNVEGEDYHTYFVGEFGLWAHNQNGDAQGPTLGRQDGAAPQDAAERLDAPRTGPKPQDGVAKQHGDGDLARG